MQKLVVGALFLTASVCVLNCNGFCLPPFGWYAMSIVGRMELGEANVVIKAHVDAIHPESPGRKPYTADLVVDCIYKDTSGAGSRLKDVLHEVPGFGGSSGCASTQVSVGKQYIVFLHRQGNSVEVAEVNSQEGAEEVLPSRLKKIEKKYACI